VQISAGLTVRADPLLLERVMENLLSNAAKHTPEGTAIEIAARVIDGAVEISVADEGPGIPEKELRYLGDRFFRGGDPNTRTRGTGLGLAVVREILRLHDATLEIESREGRGSRFSFALPATRPAAATV
jgi:two-component system OmpR family sensor kinase